MGSAALAVIRISGTGCLDLVSPMLQAKKALLRWEPHKLHRATFNDPESGVVVDDLLAVAFTGPRSFTGQDSAEFHCHGSPYVAQRILSCLYRTGFRAADPGEFTRRAFLNGKIDLTGAEGIRELVESTSEQQWLVARQLMSGHLRREIDNLRQKLIEAMAFLEARIDFPDEGDTAGVELNDVDRRVDSVRGALAALASTYDSGRVASQGLMVALFGRPNVGKSTLLNTLLGRERAIVSDIAGTTRDYLEERCLINGRLIRLVDMAGIRENTDEIEKIGVDRARAMARDADVILHLIGPETPVEDILPASKWLHENVRGEILSVHTKADIQSAGTDGLWVSCKSGAGIGDLKAKLASFVDHFTGSLREGEAFLATGRQAGAVTRAQTALTAFHNARTAGMFDECLAFELQESARALTSVIGDVSNDDVLDAVFSSFCVGK